MGQAQRLPLSFFGVMLMLLKHLLVMIVMVMSIRLSESRWYPLVEVVVCGHEVGSWR